MTDLSQTELFERLNREFLRVGIGPDALLTADRRIAGRRPPKVPRPKTEAINWNLGMFALALDVLESLPDGAGEGPFVDAFFQALTSPPGGAGA